MLTVVVETWTRLAGRSGCDAAGRGRRRQRHSVYVAVRAVRSASGVRAPIAIYARIRHFLALHNPRQLPIGSMLNVTSYMR